MTSNDRTIGGFDDDAILHWVKRTVQRHRWSGWQGLDQADASIEERVLLGAYELALHSPTLRPFVAGASGAPAAATIVTPEPMVSEHLEVATASVAHVLCADGTTDRHSIIRELLEQVVDISRQEGTDLLVHRVAADDVEGLSAAQRAGFDVCDATLTFLADAAADVPTQPAPGLTVETHEGVVSDVLSAEELRGLESTATLVGLSHYRADPALPHEAIDRLHGEVVRAVASGTSSDCLTVVRHDGQIVGLESEVTDRTLRDLTGLDLRRCNLLSVRPDDPAACRALFTAVGRRRFPGGSLHTWELQIRDTDTIRCVERSGVAQPVRAELVLHRWLR